MSLSKKTEVLKTDITQLQVDAIVNAANRSLLGGGGVDGAIHRAAGKMLMEECRQLNGCPTGEAKMTKGYNLPAKFIIHAVGPVRQGGFHNEEKLLAGCYQNALKLAEDQGLNSIAFPNISTGIYRFPKDLAAQIAIGEVNAFLKKSVSVHHVIFACFDEENYQLYKQLI